MCYLCGQRIVRGRQLRRRVKTGEWVRRRYAQSRVSHVQTSFGMRIVCGWCARRIDRQDLRSAWQGHLSVVLALLGMLLAAWLLQ